MTTVEQRQITCAVCGATHRHSVVITTNARGYADLDTRSPPMARWANLRIVLRCAQCGYCAPDLSEYPPMAPATVESSEYRSLFTERGVPRLARHWACWSLVQEQAADAAGAGWAALQAAWVCDDAGKAAGAERFRFRAIELFQEVQRSGGSFAQDHVMEQLLLLDLLRRAGRFDDVLRLCRKLEASDIAPGLNAILYFQRFLAKGEDRRAYKTKDAQEYAEAPDTWEPPPPPSKGCLASLFRR